MDLIKTLLLSLGEGAIASLPVSGPPHESWLMQALGIPALPLMLHALACLCALIVWIVWFRRWLWKMIRYPLHSPVWWVLLADVPIAACMLYAGDVFRPFAQPVYLGVCLVVHCVALLLGDVGNVLHETRHKTPTVFDGLAAGLLQVVSLIPGFSRLGSAAAGSMCTGLGPRRALDFAYVTGIPLLIWQLVRDVISLSGAAAMAGQGFFEGLGSAVTQLGGPAVVAVFAAGALAAGFLCVWLARLIVRRFGLRPFAVISGATGLYLITRQLLNI